MYSSTLTTRDFVCAVLAHGDIDYIPLDRLGQQTFSHMHL
jgi:hypothetical protein